MNTTIEKGCRVLAEGYAVKGEVLMIIAGDGGGADGRIAKVQHDDGFANYYRVGQLTVVNDAVGVRYVNRREP